MSTSEVNQTRGAAAAVNAGSLSDGNGDLAGPLPEWWASVERAFQTLLTWPDDWDSYGAAAPRREAVDAARVLLTVLVRRLDVVEPYPSATRNGGVFLEWRRNGHEIDVEIESLTDITFAYENMQTGEQVCGESKSADENTALLLGLLEQHFCQ
ncbi:MAG TPA: hypothetical protein VML55_13315 [Planctomycetaceae bacterium]|nr:hypothetical protein [Planctomycetaceae bacterium]